ncbi:MAG: ADP-ribosylglycohydrolase family protein [Desulfovibrionaceae bacterium]|nr:ADP-ribosylglycohydrolase family protein [Desulfovibrionaceae bacterium]
MLGALIGDIVGSRFEWHNHRSKDFPLFSDRCSPTDDSVMSLAVCQALLNSEEKHTDLTQETISAMVSLGRAYPDAGYGGRFRKWLRAENKEPYNSFGNGAAMRVSGCAYVGTSLKHAQNLAEIVTKVTHNHPEGIKGALATTDAIYLARTGASLEEIRTHCSNYYTFDQTIDEMRPTYHFDISCQGTVPPALQAFFEATSFEDAVRTAISLGGDSDTLAAITGSVAEAYFGIPQDLRTEALSFLDENLSSILSAFELKYPSKII